MNTPETEITESSVGQAVYFDKCDDLLPRAQMCNSIRFTQMLLLKPVKTIQTDTGPGTKTRDIVPGGFLILQPRACSLGSVQPPTEEAIQRRVARFRQKIEHSMPITSAIVAGHLPDPGQGYEAMNEIRAILLAHGRECGELRTDEEVVRAYASFIRTSMRAEKRPASRLLSLSLPGFRFDDTRILEEVEDALEEAADAIEEAADAARNLLDPGPSQPMDSPQPHIALCAVFEQRWCHTGYTRGERVATIALAPGEEITLEVHSWVKETVKSERELLVESETRLSNKLTTRDHFEVANELATKGHLGFNASINLTIPVEGIPIGIGGGYDLSGDLSNTLTTTQQRTTEQTAEAANTLRSTRRLRIEEARETGRDDKQLRKVVNTNRCHTLNVHYFEVFANYEVSLQLVKIQPCLLLPVTIPTVTPKWVLCHAHVLNSVLLDKTFLPGFDGAKMLEMQEQLEALQEVSSDTFSGTGLGTDGGGLSGVEAEMGRLRDDILAAFGELKDTLDDSEVALDDLSDIKLLQWPSDLLTDVTEAIAPILGSFPQLIYWGLLVVNADAFSALRNLEHSTGRPALESLRNFFAVVKPGDYEFKIVADTVNKSLLGLGIAGLIAENLIRYGLIDLVADDAGLHVAVKAAHKRLKAVEQQAALTAADEKAEETFSQAASGPGFTTELDGLTRLQLAEAKVEFERLKCHILNNCDHYFHAIWALEGSWQSLASLHGYEGLVSFKPTGFVGKKAAFPLLDPKSLETYFDPESLQKAAEDIIESNSTQKPMVITLPTPGPIAEATLGQCYGCDDFIMQHRDLDVAARAAEVKRMEAEATQAEFEAKRLEERIKAGELADPTPFERADRIEVSVEADSTEP